jgi:hypothetical protein
VFEVCILFICKKALQNVNGFCDQFVHMHKKTLQMSMDFLIHGKNIHVQDDAQHILEGFLRASKTLTKP